MTTPTLYGMLHLAPGQPVGTSVRITDFDDQRSLYLRNAVTLHRSLACVGVPMALLTNDRETLVQQLGRLGIDDEMDIREIDFPTPLPDGLNFFSSHHKIDAFRYLAGQQPGAYVGLVDLDVVAMNGPPAAWDDLVARRVPVVYDVSDMMVPAVGADRIRHDMQQVWPGVVEGRWMGGEFLAGRPAFFRQLVETVETILPRYLEVRDRLYHEGDETLISVAVEKLRQDGLFVADAGMSGIVARYWSVATIHWQEPLERFGDVFLLHLLLDKRFLAGLPAEAIGDADRVMKHYRRYLLKTGRAFPRLRRAAGNVLRALGLRKMDDPGRIGHT